MDVRGNNSDEGGGTASEGDAMGERSKGVGRRDKHSGESGYRDRRGSAKSRGWFRSRALGSMGGKLGFVISKRAAETVGG
jgi:hypothetical protein